MVVCGEKRGGLTVCLLPDRSRCSDIPCSDFRALEVDIGKLREVARYVSFVDLAGSLYPSGTMSGQSIGEPITPVTPDLLVLLGGVDDGFLEKRARSQLEGGRFVLVLVSELAGSPIRLVDDEHPLFVQEQYQHISDVPELVQKHAQKIIRASVDDPHQGRLFREEDESKGRCCGRCGNRCTTKEEGGVGSRQVRAPSIKEVA